MSDTPRVNSWWNSYRSGAITADEFRDAVRGLESELETEKADYADTQRQWNDALDAGLKVVRPSRLTN